MPSSRALGWTAAFLCFLPALLWLDVDARLWTQAALGVATTLLLVLAVLPLEPDARQQVYACVVVSTAIELFATQVWGVYAYRLGNVPLFVPPGHGLICAVAIHLARVPLLVRRARQLVGGTLALAVIAAAAGVFVLPRFGLPVDLEGALFLPGFVWLLLGTRRAAEHAVTFFLATFVELVGVYFGNWHWNALMPVFGLTAGNPPSVAAGGYCWFSALGVLLLAGMQRARGVPAIRAG